MSDKDRDYSNGELTVHWRPEVCIHSKKCFAGLSSVFNPNKRPWVDLSGAEQNAIVEQVKKCPSGALSYSLAGAEQEAVASQGDGPVVEVSANGPLLIKGPCVVRFPDGTEQTRGTVTALCRCGASRNKPFCDGSHRSVEFTG